MREFWPLRERVLRLAWKIVGNSEEAEDLVQEVFLACLCALSRKGADFCTSPEGYLFRSTYNRAADRFRKKTRHPTTSLEESVRNPENSPPEESIEGVLGENPRDEALLSEIGKHLDDALSRLSLRERRAFVLRVFEVNKIDYDQSTQIS